MILTERKNNHILNYLSFYIILHEFLHSSHIFRTQRHAFLSFAGCRAPRVSAAAAWAPRPRRHRPCPPATPCRRSTGRRWRPWPRGSRRLAPRRFSHGKREGISKEKRGDFIVDDKPINMQISYIYILYIQFDVYIYIYILSTK